LQNRWRSTSLRKHFLREMTKSVEVGLIDLQRFRAQAGKGQTGTVHVLHVFAQDIDWTNDSENLEVLRRHTLELNIAGSEHDAIVRNPVCIHAERCRGGRGNAEPQSTAVNQAGLTQAKARRFAKKMNGIQEDACNFSVKAACGELVIYLRPSG
jgi:hypothetical protein